MKHLELFATTLLLSSTTLLACEIDPELDEALLEAEDLDPDYELRAPEPSIPEELDEADLEELELQGEDHEQTVSCDLGLPSLVYAGPSKSRTVSGQIWGIAAGYYFLDGVRFGQLWLSNWIMKLGTTTVASLVPAVNNLFFASDGTNFTVQLDAPPAANPGNQYKLEVKLYTYASQLACTDTVTLEIADCGQVGWWSQGPWPTPWYDNANCYVTNLPAGSQSFVWQNNWYVQPTNGTQCSIGTYDGANCYIGSAPGGHTAFIYANNLYYTL